MQSDNGCLMSGKRGKLPVREAVVLIHGIWMTGWEMAFIRRRLKASDFETYLFRYHSLRYTPHRNALFLKSLVNQVDADIVHFVAHSMGGIVIMHLFEQDPVQRPGRVLLLGTPLNGSALARRLYKMPFTRFLLGNSIDRGLLGGVPPWQGGRDLGMIAGNRGIGLGNTLWGGLQRPNDGTVSLAETRSPAVGAHLTVPYSHLGMLFSSHVAQAVCHFLRHGEFAE